MATFPTTEPEVTTLAISILGGLNNHPEDFENIDPMPLASAYSLFNASRTELESARAAYRRAMDAKNTALATLKAIMRQDIKQAEIDNLSTPDKLYEIGWGPKANPNRITAPGAPTNLRSRYEGPGILEFSWDKPKSGGAVRNYCLYRTTNDPESGLAKWTLVDFFYDNVVIVGDQPRGKQLYYMITAANGGGTSPESNVLPVVL